MKKNLSLFLILILLFSLLVGCSKKSSHDNVSETEVNKNIEQINEAGEEDKIKMDERVAEIKEVQLVEVHKLKYDVDKNTGNANILNEKSYSFDELNDIEVIINAFSNAKELRDYVIQTSPQYSFNVIEKDTTKNNTYFLYLEDDKTIVQIGEQKYFKIEEESNDELLDLLNDGNDMGIPEEVNEVDDIKINEENNN